MLKNPITPEDMDKMNEAILAVPEGTPIEEVHKHLPEDVLQLVVKTYVTIATRHGTIEKHHFE